MGAVSPNWAKMACLPMTVDRSAWWTNTNYVPRNVHEKSKVYHELVLTFLKASTIGWVTALGARVANRAETPSTKGGVACIAVTSPVRLLMIAWKLAARVCSGNLVNIIPLKQGTKLTWPMAAAWEEDDVVESCESALLAFPERVVTMPMLVTTWSGVKAANAPWIIRRAEKAEAIVERNMISATSR